MKTKIFDCFAVSNDTEKLSFSKSIQREEAHEISRKEAYEVKDLKWHNKHSFPSISFDMDLKIHRILGVAFP